jgi:NADH-quinone oxidoreductase subunit E/NADP-reducing hydrogenase subunit HndA
VEKELRINAGETTVDGRFSIRCVRCLGACGQAPVVMVGDNVHGKVKSDEVRKTLRRYK